MPRTKITYSVYPRYSGGSPAMVDEPTAFRVQEQEREMAYAIREGAMGKEAKEKLRREGLRGIVIREHHKGGKLIKQDAMVTLYYGDVPDRCFRNPEETLIFRPAKARKVDWFFKRRPFLLTTKKTSEMLEVFAALKQQGYSDFEVASIWGKKVEA